MTFSYITFDPLLRYNNTTMNILIVAAVITACSQMRFGDMIIYTVRVFYERLYHIVSLKYPWIYSVIDYIIYNVAHCKLLNHCFAAIYNLKDCKINIDVYNYQVCVQRCQTHPSGLLCLTVQT